MSQQTSDVQCPLIGKGPHPGKICTYFQTWVYGELEDPSREASFSNQPVAPRRGINPSQRKIWNTHWDKFHPDDPKPTALLAQKLGRPPKLHQDTVAETQAAERARKQAAAKRKKLQRDRELSSVPHMTEVFVKKLSDQPQYEEPVRQAVHTDEPYNTVMRQNEAELEAARQRAQQAVQDYNDLKRQMAEMAAGAASAESLTLAFAEWGIDVDDDDFSGVPATDTPGPSLAEEE